MWKTIRGLFVTGVVTGFVVSEVARSTDIEQKQQIYDFFKKYYDESVNFWNKWE